MEFSDARWVGLKGGYGAVYDPRPVLQELSAGGDVDTAWAELWNELHHQGDVGEASYASVSAIVRVVEARPNDWNGYALASTIEEARLDARNPALPDWLAVEYAMAWRSLFRAGLNALPEADDDTLVSSILSVLATHKRQPMLARMAMISEAERRDMLDEVGWG